MPNEDFTSHQTIANSHNQYMVTYQQPMCVNGAISSEMVIETPTMNQSTELNSGPSLYQAMNSQTNQYDNTDFILNESIIGNQTTSANESESFIEGMILDLALTDNKGNLIVLLKRKFQIK